MALLGAVLPLLSERLHFNMAQAGNLFLAMNGAMLVTTLALGPMLDRFGHKTSLVIAPLFVAVALACIREAEAFEVLMIGVILLGAGGGALNQTTNTLVADLYSDSREKSAALNRLGVFFGFGALFLPFCIGALLRVLGFGAILYLAIALSLIPAIWSGLFRFPAPHARAGVPAREVLRIAREPLVLTLSILLFFESGNEFILGGYLTTFLTRVRILSVSTSSYLLAAYWGALMLGRVILSRTISRRGEGNLILASALGVAGSMVLLLSVRSTAVTVVSVISLGFCTATIFPTVLGMAGSRYASRSGTVFGILIGIALAGGMILPWLTGEIAHRSGIRVALILSIWDALAIFLLQIVARRVARE